MERQITLEQALQAWRDRIVAQETEPHIATSALYDLATQQLSPAEAEAVLAHLYRCPSCRVEWHALLQELAADGPPLSLPAPETAVLGTELTPHPAPRWYGGSTTPLRPVIKASLAAAPNPAAESDTSRVWLFQSQDDLVTATVRVLTERTIAVAIETEAPQCAGSQWHFRFAYSRDDTEICRGTLTLRAEEPGFWEGRVELKLSVDIPPELSFQFFSLPRDSGDTP